MHAKKNNSAAADIPHRHHLVLWSRLKLRWPFLVWTAVVFLAIYLGYQSQKYGFIVGTVTAVNEDIGVTETSRLAALLVQPGDIVKSGDAVVELDHMLLDVTLAEQEAQYAYELSTLDALQWQIMRTDRQFAGELAAAAEGLLSARIQLGRDAAELKALDAEVKRLANLLANGLVDSQMLSQLRVQQAALQQAVEMAPALIREREQHLQEAHTKYDDTKPWLGGDEGAVSALQKLTAARQTLQKQRQALILAQRTAGTLRVKSPGIVSRVFFNAGSIVAAGTTIIRVVAGNGRVTGFMNETDAHNVAVGMHATIMRNSGLGAAFEAHVVEVGPEIEALPQRISPVPGQTIRGRRFILQLPLTTDLIPGEAVRIQLQQSPWKDMWQSIRSLLHGGPK